MNSLLQRRNKNFIELKKSISLLSVVKKAEQHRQNQEARQIIRQCKTSKQLEGQQLESPAQQHMPKHMDSIAQSCDSQFLNNSKMRYFQFNQSESKFQQAFKIQEKLGEGAHGVVKKCIYKDNGKVFAVKYLQMEDQHYRSLKTNFINIKQLKHENIIKYKALYLNPKKRLCLLVMEYSRQPSLKPGMDESSLRLVLYKILDALTYIHEKNICHRDIKPQNILCNLEMGIVKIIDFGVSKNMKLRGRYEEMLTNTGTCQYKAPQMFLGGSYTQKVDSWAIGITLYELIAGYRPFDSSDFVADTINNIISNQVQFDSPKFSNFSSLVKDLIARLLNKNPHQRLSCEQAKRHLWFVPHLNDIDLSQSAGGFNIKRSYTSQENLGLTWMLQRRSSVNDIDQSQPLKMNKSEKETTKRWLEIVNEDQSVGQFNFDLMQSDDEDNNLSKTNQSNTVSLGNIKFEGKDSLFTI